MDAMWFHYELDQLSVSWVFYASDSYRMIAALELLTTLICLQVLAPDSDKGTHLMPTRASDTDNRGYLHAVAQHMFKKFPLM